MDFRNGDIVRVTCHGSAFSGWIGRVEGVSKKDNLVSVFLKNGNACVLSPDNFEHALGETMPEDDPLFTEMFSGDE